MRNAGYAVHVVAPCAHDHEFDGVRIHAVRPARNRWERFLITGWLVLARGVRVNGSVYHLHDSELLFAGLVLKLVGKRVAYDVHESLVDDLRSRYWLPQPLRRPIARVAGTIEAMAARHLDAVIATTRAIAAPFPPPRTRVVCNYPIEEELAEERASPHRSREAVAVYVGEISCERGLTSMVEAIGLVPAWIEPTLLLIGELDPPESLHVAERLPGWARTSLTGRLDRGGVAMNLNRSRVGLAIYQPDPRVEKTLSTKLFEYMAVGIPVIVSDLQPYRGIVEEAGCGLTVDPQSPAEVAEALTCILTAPDEAERMGEAGSLAVRQRFNWAREEAELLAVYEHLLKAPLENRRCARNPGERRGRRV